MELPTPAGFPGLVDAVNSGRLPMTDLDDAVNRVLTAKFRAGLFEHPYVDEERAVSGWQQGERPSGPPGR